MLFEFCSDPCSEVGTSSTPTPFRPKKNTPPPHWTSAFRPNSRCFSFSHPKQPGVHLQKLDCSIHDLGIDLRHQLLRGVTTGEAGGQIAIGGQRDLPDDEELREGGHQTSRMVFQHGSAAKDLVGKTGLSGSRLASAPLSHSLFGEVKAQLMSGGLQLGNLDKVWRTWPGHAMSVHNLMPHNSQL